MAPGEQGTMTVNVKNIGLTKVSAKNYKINFYLNGQLINTIDRDGDKDGNEDYAAEAMEVGKSQTFAISFTAPNAASAKIYAEVVNEADEEARNNKTEEASIVIIGAKTLPAPQLTGSKTDNGITITWQDPKGKVVEGAENFAAFTYDGLADWTMYDGDQGYTQKPSSYNMAVNYPNWSMPKAFIVFNPEQAGLNLTGSAAMFIPHSGDQYFAGFFTAVPSDNEEGYEEVTCDDWMISPRLSGQAQTVSFWAKGYQGSVATGYETEASFIETLQILASKGEDTDLADFEVVTETFEVNAEEWTKYTVDLPEGTNFFAIHRNTEAGNAFVLLIDDINFEVEAQTVQGYNIYKNGALVANQKSTSYTDADGAGTDIYTVTAVYADGESGQSNKFWADAPSGSTVKGDANGDGELDVRDVMLMTNFLMYHGTQSTNADVNGDGEVDIRDIVALIDLLMKE
jgi:hypothetical protein